MKDNSQRVFIGGVWRESRNPSGILKALNPATGELLPCEFPVSSWADIEAALSEGSKAAAELQRSGPDSIADFLDNFADAVDERASEIAELAHLETALPVEPRLRSVEMPRTVDQIRRAAASCRDRSWCRATIDTASDIRSKYGALGGPVAVFGPNNFPLAFNSVGGGDSVSALAAGNPVISKAHPGHPGTTRIFAEAAAEALERSGLPRATVQLLYHFAPENGFRLVSHPHLGASAFTGSRSSGLKLKEAADSAGRPVYLEMSSINPVFLLPGAVVERADEIAGELFHSCLLGSGQFCTKPGLVVLLKNEMGESFLRSLKAFFDKSDPGFLLGRTVLEGLTDAVRRLESSDAALVTGGKKMPGPELRFQPTLYRVSGEDFMRNPDTYQVESFGALSIIVFARNFSEMKGVAAQLDGQLTGAIYSRRSGEDDSLYDELEPLLRLKAGRLTNDKMPTGVTVSPAMVHGGPFPAAGHPGFTSVGIPASMLRFASLQCFDGVRSHRLPPELRDRNPTGRMWRFIDGEWTRRSLA